MSAMRGNLENYSVFRSDALACGNYEIKRGFLIRMSILTGNEYGLSSAYAEAFGKKPAQRDRMLLIFVALLCAQIHVNLNFTEG